jgi:CPA1 family monovalent cation:H+ antiporter
MDLLTIIAILVSISATFSYLNERFLRLPGTIGMVAISVTLSILILLAGKSSNAFNNTVVNLAEQIDFSKVLLDVLLGFLLFASALHFDYRKLREQRAPVFLLSTLGVLLSASLFGILFYFISSAAGFDMPLIYCFIFGALISPTDPIAIAAILKSSPIPPRLHTIISGESLFNDGLGLVLFITLLDIVIGSPQGFQLGTTLKLILVEIAGGIAIGIAAGFVGYRMIRSVKDFHTIFLISIALVLSISLIANKLHASIPLAAVTAGLIIGTQSLNRRSTANRFLTGIWNLIDEVLNTVLFVLIGLQLVLIPSFYKYWLVGILSIFAILAARVFSISLPAFFLLRVPSPRNLMILTWAGLRGGISLAMALTLPDSEFKKTILATCYIIVIFSIIIQGLTLGRVVKWASGTKKE